MVTLLGDAAYPLLPHTGQGAALLRTVNPLLCFARELAVRLTPVTPMVRLFARINRRAGTDTSTHRNP